MSKNYRISIESAPDYNEIYADVEFKQGIGFIVSQERGDKEFDIFIACKNSDSWTDFMECRNVPEQLLRLEEVIKALEEAKEKLEAMPKRIPKDP